MTNKNGNLLEKFNTHNKSCPICHSPAVGEEEIGQVIEYNEGGNLVNFLMDTQLFGTVARS